jgi:hypothetical protein
MEQYKLNYNFILILLGFLIEASVFTFIRNEYHYYRLPIIGFIGAMMTGLGVYLESKRNFSIYELKSSNKINSLGYIALILAATFVSYYILQICFANPLDPRKSDVIPTIQTMVVRVLNFQNPNKLIQYDGYSFEPAYLTMHYLPFCIAEKIKLDYRFFAYFIFVVSLVPLVKWIHERSLINIEIIIKAILPFLFLFYLCRFNDPIIMHAVELMDVAFVILLAYSIFSKSWFLQGIAVVCCLLSRYGIVVWLPFFAFFLYNIESKERVLKSLLVVVSGVCILYVFPFMIKDPFLFFKGLNSYNVVGVTLWDSIPDWYGVKKPYTLTQGFGFAIFFDDYLNCNTESKINIIKAVQIGLCLIFLFLCSFSIKKEIIKNKKLFILFTLKIFMTIFYAFLFAPFSYLYLVPFFVTIVAIFQVGMFKIDPSIKDNNN